jgi:hypothetical protein
VRGIKDQDLRCRLVKDDSAVSGKHHYPCIIYMREQGEPIGKVGPGMHQERLEWFKSHVPIEDPICSGNCLDVCVTFNQRCAILAA